MVTGGVLIIAFIYLVLSKSSAGNLLQAVSTALNGDHSPEAYIIG